jgi:uncharacterized coiled-coil DUF342 family protein
MATLVQQIEDLKRQLKSAKMKITKLEKKSNGTSPEVDRLRDELEASRRECGSLLKLADQVEDQMKLLEEQCEHYQKLIAHTAAVTVWKIQ